MSPLQILILNYISNSEKAFLFIKDIKKDLGLKDYGSIRKSLIKLNVMGKITLIKYKGKIQILK